MSSFIKKCPLFFSFLSLLSACNGSDDAAKTVSSALHEDIDFITKTLFENHPGVYNADDPGFVTLLTTAEKTALENVSLVESERDHVALLKQFTRTFNDTHLAIWSKITTTNAPTADHDEKVFSIEPLAGSTAWVTLPTFAPNDTQKKQLMTVIDKLPSYHNHRYIIFDVRGNNGGSSTWGEGIVKATFGTAFAEEKSRDLDKGVFVDWRTSADNTEYLGSLLDYLAKQFGPESQIYQEITKIHHGMTESLAAGDFYYRESCAKESTLVESSSTASTNLCSANIIVLIDGSCVSACLDFIDYLKILGLPVTLVGQTTKADSVYMEVRSVELPSKIGHLAYPIKVYRNRKRGHNQPYHPDIMYDGDLNATEALKAWLLTNVIV